MIAAVPDWVDSRRLAMAALAASGAALLAAFASQYIGGLEPCELCLWQRYAHGAAIALLLPAAFVGPAGARAFLALGGAAFLAGAGIAGFHVGVEQSWWAGTSACGADPGAAELLSLADLKAALQAPAGPRCDEVAWSLFGISMAGYNGLFSLALATGCLGWAGFGAGRRA